MIGVSQMRVVSLQNWGFFKRATTIKTPSTILFVTPIPPPRERHMKKEENT
jgi:hypothetical protein